LLCEDSGRVFCADVRVGFQSVSYGGSSQTSEAEISADDVARRVEGTRETGAEAALF